FAYMIRQNKSWHDAKIRVIDISADVITSGKTVADLEETLSEIRIQAEPEIVACPGADAVAAYSRDAALVFLPFRLVKDQPRDPFGDDLSPLLSRLPVTAAVLAARDIDLAAEPESGPAGEIAEAVDRYNDALKRAKDAEKAAEKASANLEKTIDALRRAVESGEDEEKTQQLDKEVRQAQNEAVASGRKAAKLSVIAENLAEKARNLGADIKED
ncbi:MAG: hypothetical protein ACLFPI_00480, partial [Desulfobacterales bacterium]